jgi:hypothetical protein
MRVLTSHARVVSAQLAFDSPNRHGRREFVPGGSRGKRKGQPNAGPRRFAKSVTRYSNTFVRSAWLEG